MKKHPVLLVAAMLILLSLSACGKSPSDSAVSKNIASSSVLEIDSSIKSSPDEIESSTNSDDVEKEDSLNTSIAEVLIMEKNEGLINAPGAIMFSTTATIEETIVFYKDILQGLNAKGEEVRETTAALDTWTWSGTYSNGTLEILVTSNSNGSGVAISYT